MIFRQHVVAIRGDDKDITMTLPAGAGLSTATSVKFTARDEDDDVVWEQTVTPSSDTVATASIGSDEWDEWDTAGEPERLSFDFEVTLSTGKVRTPMLGTITVVQDVTR